MATRTLVGYAVLRANFNYNAPSYVDNFSMFVLDALSRRHPQLSDAATIAEDIRTNFGFTIPDRVVGTLLRRASKKHGVINQGGRYGIEDEEVRSIPDINAEIATFGRQQDELVSKFTDFVSELAPQHLHLIEAEPANHLSDFVDAHAAPLLAHALRSKAGPVEPSEFTGPDFLVATFIKHLSERDATAFGYVVDLVKGAILAAVLDTGANDLHRKLADLHFVLDTPILLKGLGYLGTVEQRAVTQTLRLASDLGGRVVCFAHTTKEVDGVLDSVVPVLRSRGARAGALREVDAHFLDKGTTAADIEIERGNLRRRMQSLGVREILPPDNHYAYGLDEAALEGLLDKEVRYRSAGTRLYDVQSLSAIHRLRKGSSPAEFERCRYVLITDNDRVVRAARKVDERHQFPLAMLDADMAALLWVRSPAVADDLPRAQLLATVHSGMQPSGHLWARYLEEIERLEISGDVNEDDALLLRARPEARAALMTETLGKAEIDTESISVVLDRVREELQGPVRAELAAAQLARETAIEVARTAQAKTTVERERRTALEHEVASLHAGIGELSTRWTAQEEAIRVRSERRAQRLTSAAIGALAVLLIAAAAVQFTAPGWAKDAPNWLGAILLASGVAVVVLGFLPGVVGGSMREWARHIEGPLAGRLEVRYREKAGLPPQERKVA